MYICVVCRLALVAVAVLGLLCGVLPVACMSRPVAERLGLFCGHRLLLGRVVVYAAPVTASLTLSQVSYTASGIQFKDRERFPRLYTLQPLVFSHNEAYVHFITSFGWRRVAVIYQVNPLFSAVSPVGGAVPCSCRIEGHVGCKTAL